MISRHTIKQRQNETKIQQDNYDRKQKELNNSKYQFQVCVTDGVFIFPETVGASSLEEAVEKVKKQAYREWGFKVKMEDIRCTRAVEI